MTELLTPLAEPVEEPARPVSALRRARRRTADVLALLVLLVVVVWALAPGLVTSRDPLEGVPGERLEAPSLAHLFGTDHLGRDLLARVIHGSALSLQATLVAVGIALVVGALLGVAAGYVGGVLDDVLMRLVDTLMAIPQLLLSMAVVTALGFGTLPVAVAVGIAAVASFARLTRGEVLRRRHAGFVESAVLSGVRTPALLGRHIGPHSAGPVLALSALQFGEAVLAVAALSFLGFGAPPPAPEWGVLVAEGRDHIATSWWLTTLPALVVVAVVLAANQVSRMIERRFSS